MRREDHLQNGTQGVTGIADAEGEPTRPNLRSKHADARTQVMEALVIWREWADHVQGEPMDTGHFFPGEAPAITAHELARCFTPAPPGPAARPHRGR